MLINSAGEQKKLTCFERARGTEAYNSCSIIWNAQLYIFGGSVERRQISRLSRFKLERVGNLSFDHSGAACSVMNNKFIYVCFGSIDGSKLCRRSTGPFRRFTEVSPSNHDHRFIETSCSDSKSCYLVT